MARKTKKSKARKAIKRVGKKPKRAGANKTQPKKVAKKTRKMKAANVRKSKKKSAAELIAMDNMAYGLGYLIP